MKPALLLPLLIFSLKGIAQAPVAKFTVSPATGCVGQTITLTSTSVAGAAPITNYVWSAPGGSPESATGTSSFTTSYSAPGKYSFSLIVQSSDGLSDIETKLDVIVINANPIADITSTVINCNQPFTVNFGIGGSSSGPGISYNWTLAGASPSTATGNNPTSTFAATGNYTIGMTVTDANTNCSTTVSEPLVLANHVVDFSAPATACVGEMVTFTDASSTGTNQWAWSFTSGSSSSSTSQNPNMSFTSAGTKDVTLVATNSLTGCTDTKTEQIEILALPQPSYTMSLREACAKDSIIFTNTSLNPAGATFTWDFGDGSPVFTGQTPPVHDYTINDTFYPVLTMLGANGCQLVFRDSVILWEPIANFNLTNWNGCAPVDVQFTDLSVAPRPITNWFWDFGDGNTSTLQNPPHTYFCGRYDVELVIRIAGGCVDTISISTANPMNYTLPTLSTVDDNDPNNNYNDILIRYGEPVDFDFTFDKRVVCAQNETVKLTALPQFNCQPENGEVEYTWYMNGGKVANTPDSVYQHMFNDTLLNGPISTRLEINYNGCITLRDSANLFWTMAPVANFDPDTSLFCNRGAVQTVQFYDTLSVYGHKNQFTFAGVTIPSQANDDVEVSYDFGDGTPVVTITDDTQLEDADKGFITHTYTNYGIYTATQLITNHTTGCTSQTGKLVSISFLDAVLPKDTTCISGNIDFQVNTNSFIDHEILSYVFSVYDNVIAQSTPNLSYPHNIAGSFFESVVVTNEAGCQAAASNTFPVFALPFADINLLSDSICENANGSFDPSSSAFGGYKGGWSHFDWSFSDGTPPITTTDFNPINTNPIPLGSYVGITLIATDGFGCVSPPAFDTIFTLKPDAQFNLPGTICDGVAGLIDAVPSKGSGPLTYQWSLDGTIVGSTTDETFPYQFNLVPATDLVQSHTYLLTVIDSHGCTDTLSKTISVRNPQIDTVITSKQGYSIDGSGGFACPPVSVDFDITTSSADGITDYSWSLGFDFDTDIDSKNEDPTGIQYSQSGNYDYFVTITDANGCTDTFDFSDYLQISGPGAVPIITLDTNDLCGQTYIFEVTNSSNVSDWSWDLGDGTVITNLDFPSDSFNYRFLDNSSFDATLTIYDSVSVPVCPVTLPSHNITLPDNGINAAFSANPTTINFGQSVLLHDLSSSINPIVSWVWVYGDGSRDTLFNGNDVNHQYFMQGDVPIELTVTDINGCTDKTRLVIFSELNFTIPDVITNVGGIGANNTWTLFADIFIDFKILIVNRWGNVVYEGSRNSLDPRYLWDGIDYKSGKPCVDGTYFWVLEGTLINGNGIKEHGYLSLFNSKSE